MSKRRAIAAMQFYFHSFLFVLVASFSSCSEDIPEMRDPCDFVRSVDEVSLSTSTNCKSCFFKFSFRKELFEFHQDRINREFRCGVECEKNTIAYYNDFFEFQLKFLHRNRDLFFVLEETLSLLTPDSLRKTDYNILQPSLIIKDRCGKQYQIAENTSIFFPDVSSNTITEIKLVDSAIIDNGTEPTEFITFYLVTGNFTSRILTGNDSDYISGSYNLEFYVIELL